MIFFRQILQRTALILTCCLINAELFGSSNYNYNSRNPRRPVSRARVAPSKRGVVRHAPVSRTLSASGVRVSTNELIPGLTSAQIAVLEPADFDALVQVRGTDLYPIVLQKLIVKADEKIKKSTSSETVSSFKDVELSKFELPKLETLKTGSFVAGKPKGLTVEPVERRAADEDLFAGYRASDGIVSYLELTAIGKSAGLGYNEDSAALLQRAIKVTNIPMALLRTGTLKEFVRTDFWSEQVSLWNDALRQWQNYQPVVKPIYFTDARSGKVRRYYRAQKFIDICTDMLHIVDDLQMQIGAVPETILKTIHGAAKKFVDLVKEYTEDGQVVKYSDDPSIKTVADRGALILIQLQEAIAQIVAAQNE